LGEYETTIYLIASKFDIFAVDEIDTLLLLEELENLQQELIDSVSINLSPVRRLLFRI